MMIPERPTLERRVLAALDGSSGSGARIAVVLGGCGSGRTSLLLRLRDLIGRTSAQYVDVERIATTPERFLHALRDSSPFPSHAFAQAFIAGFEIESLRHAEFVTPSLQKSVSEKSVSESS